MNGNRKIEINLVYFRFTILLFISLFLIFSVNPTFANYLEPNDTSFDLENSPTENEKDEKEKSDFEDLFFISNQSISPWMAFSNFRHFKIDCNAIIFYQVILKPPRS